MSFDRRRCPGTNPPRCDRKESPPVTVSTCYPSWHATLVLARPIRPPLLPRTRRFTHMEIYTRRFEPLEVHADFSIVPITYPDNDPWALEDSNL
jgi:hypothetical protein